jgi:hypothetical protein
MLNLIFDKNREDKKENAIICSFAGKELIKITYLRSK